MPPCRRAKQNFILLVLVNGRSPFPFFTAEMIVPLLLHPAHDHLASRELEMIVLTADLP